MYIVSCMHTYVHVYTHVHVYVPVMHTTLIIIRTVTCACLKQHVHKLCSMSTAPLSPSQVSELIIPTVDTARQRFFLDTYIGREQDQVPLLFVGPTGTGKSAITNNYLVRLPKDKYVYVLVAIY